MNTDSNTTRRMACTLLIVVALAILAGRIFSVERIYEPSVSRPANIVNGWLLEWPDELPPATPTFSSNDRSRWATVRALVDEGHYWIGTRDDNGKDHGFIFDEYDWKTIDRVLDPKTGKHFYSSKPPLLATLMAGQYWVMQKVFGWRISEQKWQVVLAGLFTFQWLPLLVYFVLLARLAERYGSTDWGRLMVVAAGCFATMPTLFAITFNNHTIGACSALFAIYATLGAVGTNAPAPSPSPLPPGGRGEGEGGRPLNFVLAGFFAAFTACCEMPATALLAALFAWLLIRSPRQTLLFFVPAAAIPLAAWFATNYLAVGEWLPVQSKIDSAWYQYEKSPWKWDDSKLNSNIDSLREPKPLYAFHLLLGHHGFFSLSPFWLIAVVGMFIGIAHLLRRGPVEAVLRNELSDDRAVVCTLALLVMTVVVVFYIFGTNNYGGWTNGPRWLMWLTPLLLFATLPALDRLALRRWTRVLGYALLSLSILSVSYRNWNPWRHPWVYNFLESQGWRPY
jgi:hypothetical protein